jgi:hypothetical protein
MAFARVIRPEITNPPEKTKKLLFFSIALSNREALTEVVPTDPTRDAKFLLVQNIPLLAPSHKPKNITSLLRIPTEPP